MWPVVPHRENIPLLSLSTLAILPPLFPKTCAVSLTHDNYIQSMVPGCSLDYAGDATKDRIRTSGTIDLDRALDNLSLKHPVKAVRKCGGVHVC